MRGDKFKSLLIEKDPLERVTEIAYKRQRVRVNSRVKVSLYSPSRNPQLENFSSVLKKQGDENPQIFMRKNQKNPKSLNRLKNLKNTSIHPNSLQNTQKLLPQPRIQTSLRLLSHPKLTNPSNSQISPSHPRGWSFTPSIPRITRNPPESHSKSRPKRTNSDLYNKYLSLQISKPQIEQNFESQVKHKLRAKR